MVTIYGTPNCAFCKVEKQWLDSKGVTYHYKDANENSQDFAGLDVGFGVPVTVITKDDERVIVRGFNRQKLAEAIGI